MGFFLTTQDVLRDGLIIAAFDACTSETHTDSCTVTQHNVEDGTPITDHVRPDPVALSLVLEVTNTPLDRDPDQFRGGPTVVSVPLSSWKPPFDGTPGAIFREASAAIRGGVERGSIEVQMFAPAPTYDRIAETEQKLIDMKGKLVTYVTMSREYRDMVIARHQLTRTAPGKADVQLDLQQVRIVTTATVAAPAPAEPRGAPMAKKGAQTPKTPQDAATMQKSDILKMIDYAKTLGGGAAP